MNARTSLSEAIALETPIAALLRQISYPKCAVRSTTSPAITSPLRSHVLSAAWTARNRKRERGSWPVIRLDPESALMFLDDRAADRQSDTHTAALACVEGFEHPLKILRIDTAPGILHAQTYTIVSFSLRSDQ